MKATPKENGDRVAEQMMLKFGEGKHAVFRSTSPVVTRNAPKAKEVENCQYTSVPMERRLKLFFEQLFLLIRLSIYGGVLDMFAEHKSIHVRKERTCCGRTLWPIVCADKFADEKHFTLLTDDPVQEDLLQQYQERVERHSPQNRVFKFMYWCRISDIGWCRTVLHDKKHRIILTIYRVSGMSWVHFSRKWKIWPERLDCEGTQIGPVLEVTNKYLQGKYEVKIRIESVNEDNSDSWVRISHGLNKLVTNLNKKDQDDNEQEPSSSKNFWWMQVIFQADERPKQQHKDVLLPAHPQELYLLVSDFGPMLNHKK